MKFIKENIRALKREYGYAAMLYNILGETLDLDTGTKRQTIQIRYVAKAILLPVSQYYETNDRDLYLDYCDFNIKVGTRVIFRNKCYSVIKVNTYRRHVAYILKIRAIEGAEFVPPPCDIIDNLVLTDSASGEFFKQVYGSDNLTLSDEVLKQLIKFPSVADNLILSDEALKQLIVSRSSVDNLILSDESTYDLTTITDDLVVAYHLNEVSGVRYDAVGSLDLTDNNTVGSTPGVTGNATVHAEVNHEYLSHADHADLRIGDNDWQMTCWVKFTVVTGHTHIIAKWAAAPNSEWILHHLSSGNFRFYILEDGSGALKICDGVTFGVVPNLTWCFVSCRHDSVNNKIGISVNDGAWDELAIADGGVREGNSSFRVGASELATYDLTGNVDAVHIWKGRLLTADELTYMYNGAAGRELS